MTIQHDREIITVQDFMDTVHEAKTVMAQIRFGASEDWVKITKEDALALVRGLTSETRPEDFEMYADVFATYDGDTMWVG